MYLSTCPYSTTTRGGVLDATMTCGWVAVGGMAWDDMGRTEVWERKKGAGGKGEKELARIAKGLSVTLFSYGNLRCFTLQGLVASERRQLF